VATTRQQQEAEVEIDPDMDPALSEVTRPSDLGFQANQARRRESEGAPLEDRPTSAVDSKGYVEIRMAETIEEFTYGNPHYTYRLEAGKRYRIPVEIARYLNNLGYIHHRG